jgi:aspartyl-tRNA(Asn)/glutamyl-tRNA(Gln) amidotransferase subunit C
MKVNSNDVLHLALLARLAVEPEETPRIATEMEALLDYFEQLRVLDTSDTEPTTHALTKVLNTANTEPAARTMALDCPLREDLPAPQGDARLLVSQAPAHLDGYFIVPKIID